jgi:hypothetical protein
MEIPVSPSHYWGGCDGVLMARCREKRRAPTPRYRANRLRVRKSMCLDPPEYGAEVAVRTQSWHWDRNFDAACSETQMSVPRVLALSWMLTRLPYRGRHGSRSRSRARQQLWAARHTIRTHACAALRRGKSNCELRMETENSRAVHDGVRAPGSFGSPLVCSAGVRTRTTK